MTSTAGTIREDICLESTYKELKPTGYGQVNIFKVVGLESTYKELKLKKVFVIENQVNV